MTEERYRYIDEIKCLHFDDQVDQLNRYTATIKHGWNALNNGIPITIHSVSKIDDISRELGTEKYHVFIVDIFVEEDGKQKKLGLTEIKKARHNDKNLAILALTRGGEGIFDNTLKDMGCDCVINKDQLHHEKTSLSFAGEKILEALQEHHVELFSSSADENLTLDDETDFPLLAVVDSIGRQNILNLTAKILNLYRLKIKPSYVRSGLSGASVLRINWNPLGDAESLPERSGKDLLLKISKNKEALEKELNRDFYGFPTGLFVSFKPLTVPVSSGEWHAIGADFQEGASTLIDWLISDEKDSTNIDNIMKSLFLDPDRSLINVYKKNKIEHEKYSNIVLWEILNSQPYRLATIKLAIVEFKELIEKVGRDSGWANVFDEKLIDKFLKSNRVVDLDQRDFKKKETCFCISHGDFHGRNILVSSAGRGFLIDPANIDMMHWASDIARLSVDLIVSGIDHGIESYQWNQMKEWCDFSSKFIRGERLQASSHNDSNPNLCITLDWIRGNLNLIHNIDDPNLKPEWEFRFALAVEFLRSAYRSQDLPAPKRVLGLVSACQALRETQAAYIDSQNNYGV